MLGCAAFLVTTPLMAGCATTGTTASGGTDQSEVTYSGGGPTPASVSGSNYYQSSDNPYHAD